MRLSPLAALAATCVVVGCSSSDSGSAPGPTTLQLPADGLPASCHPFRTAGVCALPFPSSLYLEPASTKSGVKLALVGETLPKVAVKDTAFDPAAWNALDGFSPATRILAYFAERLDVASLPSQHAFPDSAKPTSATVIVDMETHAFVEHFSELDQSPDLQPTDHQTLMMHPARRLRPAHRYAVGITRSLKTKDGGTPTSPPGFASALAGATSDDPVAKKALDALPATLDALAAAGVGKDQLLLAWDFTTASDEAITGHVLSMRDQALAEVGPDGAGYTITAVEEDPTNQEIYRHVTGTFDVPSFLTNDDRSIPEAALALDEAGKPKKTGTWKAPFTMIIPRSALTRGPLPLIVFGHGLMGDADGEMTGSHVRQFCNDKGFVAVGTDWIGLSHTEGADPGASGAAIVALRDFSKLGYVTDRLQEALVGAMVLARTAKGKIAADPQIAINGASPIAAGDVGYYGISLGGIMGMSFMGYGPDVLRGVVNVPGAAWSLMMQRSEDWPQFYINLRNSYPDFLDQELLIALGQSLFDYSDPVTVAPHVVADPLPGTPKKHVLLEMGVDDTQVPNLATEAEVRSSGIPLLTPSAKDVWGVTTTTGDADSAFTIWDLSVTPLPETNVTPESNIVHEGVRRVPECEQMTDVFLRTGKVNNTCNGPCKFP